MTDFTRVPKYNIYRKNPIGFWVKKKAKQNRPPRLLQKRQGFSRCMLKATISSLFPCLFLFSFSSILYVSDESVTLNGIFRYIFGITSLCNFLKNIVKMHQIRVPDSSLSISILLFDKFSNFKSTCLWMMDSKTFFFNSSLWVFTKFYTYVF